ncbi:MAG: hypothetical protein JSU72_10995 [Deltaproteobacteria bacterium]|nr:MAG: hypothetical protein JSU72_10995 [Deltaproteobacteria bacterium]
MKITKRPTLVTIIYGLMCGISFLPIVTAMSYLFHWPLAFRLTMWLYLAGYLVFLTRWSKVGLRSSLFPLLLLLILVFWGNSNTAFLVIGLGILGWIRSGICFQRGLLKTLVAELVICLGGTALVACFTPHSLVTWSLAVWMFFLVQSLYFVFFSHIHSPDEDRLELDPFEQAKSQAESILADSSL